MADEKRWGGLITTGIVRGNFMYIGERDPGRGKIKGGKYSATLIIPKDDKYTLDIVREAIKDVGQVDSLSELDKHPLIDDDGNLRDGDAEEMSEYEGYNNCVYFKVVSDREPEAFIFTEEGDIERVTDRDEIKREFYNGAYYRFTLTPHYYENTEKKKTRQCVTFFLSAVLKVQDGDKLGRGVDNRQAFITAMSMDNPLVAKKASPKKARKEIVEEEPEEEVLEEEVVEETEVEIAPKEEPKAPVKKRARKSASVTSLLD
jgi:hypothetical protein